ncbi:MAG: hypothetical protein B7Y15_00325 [Bacteroidetes bacterium 24-39-8]|jgi:hypothetical protein|nr:MAG: hypothetical protein B7Y15_00325 [Bacteroidetes bacterium 24-39-8]
MLAIKKIRLLATFYKSFLIASLIINLCCISLFWLNGMGIFNVIFWFKIASLGLTYYFLNSYKNKEYYYYYNLGISKLQLWASTLIFDLVCYLTLIFLTYQFK